jgi:predicted ATPase/DNA-binding SARP family transcriptional activator
LDVKRWSPVKALVEFHLLGPVAIRYQGQPVQQALPAKAIALLCYLAVTGETHSRQHLAGLFWGNVPEAKALGSLRVALNTLRKVIPNVVEASHLTVRFDTALDHWLDTTACAALLDPAVLAKPESAPALLALYRGEFLTGVAVEDAPGFAEWLLVQREHWRQRVLAGLNQIGATLLAAHDYRAAVPVLQRQLALQPWAEEIQRQLILAYGRLGDFAAALAQYERCRQALAEGLGVEPMPATVDLVARIQGAQARPGPVLPSASAPLIGREAEVQQLYTLLTNPVRRLVTVTGIGGIGKTRLALAVAERVAGGEPIHFLQGVVFVALEGVEQGAALPFALAQALGIALADPMGAEATLLAFLKNRELLLVLDSFEHLLPTDEVETESQSLALIETLIDHCPFVKLLITSREALKLGAEWRFDLDGLALPPLSPFAPTPPAGVELEAYGAAQLFVHAATQVQPTFRLTAANAAAIHQLCHLVGGLPLALHLAAARLSTMNLDQLLAEVQHNLALLTSQEPDLPRRHQSLWAIFEQSWTVLSPAQQRMLAALALCRGRFTAAAAAAIAQATPMDLATLIDRSLLRVRTTDEVRYEFHALIRHFALQQLAAGDAWNAANQRHCAFYLALAERTEQEQLQSPQHDSAATLAWDRDNFLAALAWSTRPSASPEDVEGGLRLMAALWPSWLWRVAWREGRDWLQRLVELSPPGAPTPGRVRALRCLAIAHHLERNLASAYERSLACVAHSRTLGDADELASSLLALSITTCELGEFAEARRCLDESAGLWTRTGTHWGVYLVTLAQGQVALREGVYDEAERSFTASLAQAHALGDPWYAMAALYNLLVLQRSQGNSAAARQRFRSMVSLSERLAVPWPQPHALAALALGTDALGDLVAWSAYLVGDHELAMRRYEAQLAHSRAQGDHRLTA